MSLGKTGLKMPEGFSRVLDLKLERSWSLKKIYSLKESWAGDGALTEAEMETYMKPFLNTGEDRRPTLTWPRQIPIAGEPENVVKIASDYESFLSESNIPKLFNKCRSRFNISWQDKREI